MHFKLGVNDNNEPVPVIDDADETVPAVVFEKLRPFAGVQLTSQGMSAQLSVKALVELLNEVGSTGWSQGYDSGWEDGSNN